MVLHEYLKELELLRRKAIETRAFLLKEYHYDELNDYRITVLEQIDRILIYHNINIVFFIRYVSVHQYIYDLFKTIESDSKRIAKDYISRNRHSLIIFLQSVVESYYREICHSLGLSVPNSFSKLIDCLFREMNIEKDSDLYKANSILAKIRNTLHNNGIHRHEDESIEYKGDIHVFKRNVSHSSANYSTLIFILSDIIDFILEIGKKTCSIKSIYNNGFNDTLK